MADGSPYKGKGETVYATEPIEKQPKEPTVESDEPKYKDKEWLYHQYKVLKKSTTEIAEENGCAPSTTTYWLNKLGIETRSISEGRLEEGTPGKLKNESWLKSQYIDCERPASELASDVGCSTGAVYEALKRFGIQRRSLSEAKQIQHNGKYKDHDWLFEQIAIKQKTLQKIADECGVCSLTIRKERDRAEIPRNERCEVWNKKIFDEKSVPKRDGESRKLVGDDLSIDASWRYFDERMVGDNWVPYKDREWMVQKYEKERMSIHEIVEECMELGCNTTKTSVWRHLIRFNVNMRDRGMGKLSVDEVKQLRKEYRDSGRTQKDLSDEYGVSVAGISRTVRGESYPDSPGPIKGEDYE